MDLYLPYGDVSGPCSRTGRFLCSWFPNTKACSACPLHCSSGRRSWVAIRFSSGNCQENKKEERNGESSVVNCVVITWKKEKRIKYRNSLDDDLAATVAHQFLVNFDDSVLTVNNMGTGTHQRQKEKRRVSVVSYLWNNNLLRQPNMAVGIRHLPFG